MHRYAMPIHVGDALILGIEQFWKETRSASRRHIVKGPQQPQIETASTGPRDAPHRRRDLRNRPCFFGCDLAQARCLGKGAGSRNSQAGP